MMEAGRSERKRFLSERWELLLMFTPGLLFFVVFHYLPMSGLVIAFKEYDMGRGIAESPWCGFDNYRHLFGGGEFLRTLRNTVTISALRLFFGFLAPIVLALLLNEIRISWYKRTVQTLSFIPFLLSWVVLGGIFRMLLASAGPVNGLLALLGQDPIQFFAHDGWFLFLIVASGIWQSIGYGAVIYMAALAGIDPCLYEAARMDGAGRLGQVIHISLPCLVPTMIVLLVLSSGRLLSAGFDQIYNLYNPLVYDVADVIDTYVVRRMITMDFALGTAADLFKSVVALGLIVTTNALARRWGGDDRGLW